MSEDMPQGEAPASTGWDRLREVREARGLTLAQVSAQIKLTPRQLEAIERGDLRALPEVAFSRGFVRNYARYLGLDPAPYLALVTAAEGQQSAGIPEQIYAQNLGRMPRPGQSRFSALPAALVVVLIALVLSAGWYFRWFEARDETALLEDASGIEESVFVEFGSSPVVPGVLASEAAAISAPAVQVSVPAPKLVEQVVTASVQSAPQSAKPVLASAPVQSVSAPVVAAAQPVAVGLPRIVLSFEGDSWVEVRDATGRVVFSRMSSQGVVQEVQGVAPFSLVIGYAPVVKLDWKGRRIDLAPYTKGDVARLTVQ